MKKYYTPKLVISIHGIRTHGHWQKTVGDILSKFHIHHESFDFDFYNLFKFVRASSREKMVDEFYDYYRNVVRDRDSKVDIHNFMKRPSVIAHSFGSWVVIECMKKHPDVVFDKIILCGSILPHEYDWSPFIANDQVNMIRNEYGSLDIWAQIVDWIVPGTGKSGRLGFSYRNNRLEEERFQYRHSDYFSKKHIEDYWVPFLRNVPSKLSIIRSRDVEEYEDFKSIFHKTTEIDDLVFRHLPNYGEVAPTIDDAISWIKYNPDIYTFLFDRQRNIPRGYLSAIPVTSDAFNKILAGEIQDKDLRVEHMASIPSKTPLKIYIMSIAIHPEVRRASEGILQEGLEKLLGGFFEKLIGYYKYEALCVSEFVGIGWTDEGKKLCEHFGMSSIKNDRFGNPIFHLDLSNPQNINPNRINHWLHRLLEIYKHDPASA